MKKTLKDLFEELVVEINSLFEFHKLLVADRQEFDCKNFKYIISYDSTNEIKIPICLNIYRNMQHWHKEMLNVFIIDEDYRTIQFRETWLLDVDEFTTFLIQVKEDMKDYINYDKLYPVDYHNAISSNNTEIFVEDFDLGELPT